jgi:hypothetical protein
MKLRTIVLCVVWSAGGVALAQSPSACSWLTLGTAENALGGDAKVTVQQQSATEGSCRFWLKSDPDTFLEIKVGQAQKQICVGAGTPLSGLGNEARQCEQTRAHGSVLEVIEGNVRELHFIITMTQAAAPPLPVSKVYRSGQSNLGIQAIAEQVVGNLF